eukprot:1560658-Rhodomonas_salina.4
MRAQISLARLRGPDKRPVSTSNMKPSNQRLARSLPLRHLPPHVHQLEHSGPHLHQQIDPRRSGGLHEIVAVDGGRRLHPFAIIFWRG